MARAASKGLRCCNANIRPHVQNHIVWPHISPKQVSIDVSLWIAKAKQESERIASFMRVLEIQSNLQITNGDRHVTGGRAGPLHFPHVPGCGILKILRSQHVERAYFAIRSHAM